MTRAGSKLVLRTSPAPGHYLCIKWDFASLHLRASRPAYLRRITTTIIAPSATQQTPLRVAGVQRLVAKTVYVERETALVVGSDNVLLGRMRRQTETVNCCLNGVLSQWFVSQFGKIDASYQIFFLGCNKDINS